jgi:type IV pilus assembly protein PilN
MENINLLPWRQTQRACDKQRFYRDICVGLAISLFVIMGVHQYALHLVSIQLGINHRLHKELQLLETPMQAMHDLKKSRERLIQMIKTMEGLEIARIIVLRLFEVFPHCLVDGVYFYQIERTGDKVVAEGYAESNSVLAQVLHRLDNSGFIQGAAIHEIKTVYDSSHPYHNQFKLSFILKPLSHSGWR